ncbi:7010_t:CDS:2 [Cetraspora pellucida]|uniref:7010_t:CDS:1 n=1 Tax=Cetraspora pellucida TaxID=1433469 RepID=A0ACA9K736_9GLOM|nr:7010_t:CDS:2 [Cetraspora pellucida]
MDDIEDLSVEIYSEAETISTLPSASSANSLTQKKRKATSVKTNTKFHSNRSHTSYFFKLDPNDSSVAYCKVCDINLSGTRNKPYPYNRRGGNTTNLINHLRDKHQITKENYLEFLDEHNEPRRDQTKITEYTKAATPCSSKQQELITQMLVSFIVKFVQLLYILQNQSFRELLLICEPGYKIPCDKTVKSILYDSFVWNMEQLRLLLTTWVTSNFEFREALLSYNHLLYPHSGEIISAELCQLSEDDHYNPLEVLTDVKTRWNSVYYAWKRILELHTSMCLVHPYIKILKKLFEPNYENGETYNTYLNLVYGTQSKNDDEEEVEESDSSTSEEDETPLGGSRQHWQYAHRQFRQQMQLTKGKGRKKSKGKTNKYSKNIKKGNSEKNIDDFNHIEYLPTADTVGLLQKVRAAIFLSLDELWSTPSDLVRIAMILDPRFKDFKWNDTNKEKDESLKLLQMKYDSEKKDFQANDIKRKGLSNSFLAEEDEDQVLEWSQDGSINESIFSIAKYILSNVQNRINSHSSCFT